MNKFDQNQESGCGFHLIDPIFFGDPGEKNHDSQEGDPGAAHVNQNENSAEVAKWIIAAICASGFIAGSGTIATPIGGLVMLFLVLVLGND
jgi:hypothetical protein